MDKLGIGHSDIKVHTCMNGGERLYRIELSNTTRRYTRWYKDEASCFMEACCEAVDVNDGYTNFVNDVYFRIFNDDTGTPMCSVIVSGVKYVASLNLVGFPNVDAIRFATMHKAWYENIHMHEFSVPVECERRWPKIRILNFARNENPYPMNVLQLVSKLDSGENKILILSGEFKCHDIIKATTGLRNDRTVKLVEELDKLNNNLIILENVVNHKMCDFCNTVKPDDDFLSINTPTGFNQCKTCNEMIKRGKKDV